MPVSLIEAGTNAGRAHASTVENDLRLVQPLSLWWISPVLLLLLLLCRQWWWHWRHSRRLAQHLSLRTAGIAERRLLSVLHSWRRRRGAIAVE